MLRRRVFRSPLCLRAFFLEAFFLKAFAAIMCLVATMTPGAAQARSEVDLSGNGWTLWLDPEAKWQNDTLHLPPVKLDQLPTVPPTGGWDAMYSNKGTPVSVPGTVEEYTWDNIGDYTGVSWWWRDFTLPKAAEGKRVFVRFESVRLRAEVFVNGELVGYDLIGNTPFEVDITGKGKIGEANRLAVRITDPSGNFAWYDPAVHQWGSYKIPAGHGFGGITGRVTLLTVDPVYVADIFVKNKPSLHDVDVEVEVFNATTSAVTADLEVFVWEHGPRRRIIHPTTIPQVELKPGASVVACSMSIPDAKTWDTEHPNLYVCEARIMAGDGPPTDAARVKFGFRWFGVDGIGDDAMLRLNGKRIVLRSAISWGFWPTNGIFPTEELARRQVESARKLGLNMINFHRCIGQTISLDKADEMGLLYFEEPGGYACHGGDAFSYAWAREKLLRMVKRDRNHPCLVIYNMINEETTPPADRNRKDMADAHGLDPTRVITYTSGWAKDGDDPIKLHMRPYDDTQYVRGWYDVHHALGPGVYQDHLYQGPAQYMLRTDNKAEIVFWGEEGANAAPPRLEKIHAHLKRTKRNGWDGAAYKEWYAAYEKYLDDKRLRGYFPTVDALTRSLGNTAYYYQGRIIENVRIGDVADGYVINGWESERLENHSGIVDCFRNPKGDVEVLAHYNQPLYIAVKVRNKIVQVSDTVVTDFYIVNEEDLTGSFRLEASLVGPNGKPAWTQQWPVTISGGDVYGQLLVEGIETQVPGPAGHYVVHAKLVGKDGTARALGRDEIFAVDWKAATVPPNGAVVEGGQTLRDFLKNSKGVTLPDYSPEIGRLDYVLVGDIYPERWAVVPADRLFTDDGKTPGLDAEYFSGRNLAKSVLKRVDAKIDFEWGGGAPAEAVGADDFSVRWTGTISPPESGQYTFRTVTDDGVRLWIADELVIDNWTAHSPQLDTSKRIALEAGKTYSIKLDFFEAYGGAIVRLFWTTPSMMAEADALAGSVLERVKSHGTTALVVAAAERWAAYMAERGIIAGYDGMMTVGNVWVGGNLFVRKHPLFKDLPVNQGMNWEYQALVNYGTRRYGLMLTGEEAVVGTVNAHEPRVGTAVAVFKHGKGRIVLSTLDFRGLNAQSAPAHVTKKLMCNYLEYAAGHE